MPPNTRTQKKGVKFSEDVTMKEVVSSAQVRESELCCVKPIQEPRQEDEVDVSAISKAVWTALEDFWSKHGVISHQTSSFNYFIETMLPHIISENSDVTTMSSDGLHSFHVQFTNPCILRPTVKEADGFERPIYPLAARYRGMSYTSSVVVDVCHEKVSRASPPTLVWRRVYREVVLCRIPVMVGSSVCYLSDPSQRSEECSYDRGGYFIINGN